MRQVVYLDVLIFLNAFVTSALLLATSALLKTEIRRIRLLIGTVLGGVLSLVIFLPPLPIPLSVLIKAVGCALLAFVSFGFRSWRIYLRTAAAFLLANFVFAGAMLALWSFIAPRGMVFNNSTPYWDVSVLLLCVSTIFCYALVRLISFITRRNAPDNHMFELTIEANAQRADCKALFDSGSALREGFSGAPVIVAQLDVVRPLIPRALRDQFGGSAPAYLSLDTPVSVDGVQSLRLIPYSSVGGTGLLPAFKAERATVRQGRKQWVCEDVYIAVSEKTFARGEYTALVGSVFFEYCKEGKL
ncbi:MAG: sigma-E processing peptidase SpoIIGA [Oscillospiraceae bacterium]|nr:sigma-E processing peptidase SpoIIGA [Oscillospiraceae bacterium]